jgi:hypothetical protein
MRDVATAMPGMPRRAGRAGRARRGLDSTLHPHLAFSEAAGVVSTARNFLIRPPTGRYFLTALPSDCFAIDFPGRASSPGEGLLLPYLHHHTFSPKGVAGLSFTARIGRAPFHRARSASKKDGLAAPYPTLLRPRVARAQEINRLHPSAARRTARL